MKGPRHHEVAWPGSVISGDDIIAHLEKSKLNGKVAAATCVSLRQVKIAQALAKAHGNEEGRPSRRLCDGWPTTQRSRCCLFAVQGSSKQDMGCPVGSRQRSGEENGLRAYCLAPCGKARGCTTWRS